MADYKLLAVIGTGKPGVPNDSNYGLITKLKVGNVTLEGDTVDGVDVAQLETDFNTLDTDFGTHDGGTAKAQHTAIGDHTHASSGAEAGTVDHGALTGRGDDDHTLYSKADGSRAFSGNVSGITPTSAAHLTRKDYVDGLVQGLKSFKSVTVRSTGNVDISSAPANIDGVGMSAGDRCLLDQQSTSTQDGIYVWNSVGNPMTRAADAPTGTAFAAAYMFVKEGSTYADIGFVCTNDGGSDVLGTDNIVMTEFSRAASYTGGDGIDVTTTVISVDLGTDSGLEIVSNQLEAKIRADEGLSKTSSGIGSVIEANKGFTVGASGFAVVADTAKAIALTSSGVGITLEPSNPSLLFASNALGLKMYANGGLQKTSNGTEIKLVSTNRLSLSSSGLDVVGLPSQFKVNGTQVGTDVTAVNLDTLTDGSSSVTLHTHDVVAHGIGSGSHTASTQANVNSKISDLTATYGAWRDFGVGTIAQRPSAGTAGRFWWATDTDSLSYDNGATWDEIVAVAADHDFEGASHNACTLAELNAANTISDADLISSTDSRLSDDRNPTTHDLDGSEHGTCTKAELSGKLTDDTLLGQLDVDDSPVDGVTTAPISSNWAYDHVNDADQHAEYQKESEKGAASGYASLSAGTLVVENPANATATPTADKIVIADGDGKIAAGWIDTGDITGSALTWSADQEFDGAVTVDELVGDGDYAGVQIPREVGSGGVTAGDMLTYDGTGKIIVRTGADQVIAGIACATVAAAQTGYYLPIGTGKALFTSGKEPSTPGENVFNDNTPGNYHKLTTDEQTDGIVYSAIAMTTGALAKVVWMSKRIFSFE